MQAKMHAAIHACNDASKYAYKHIYGCMDGGVHESSYWVHTYILPNNSNIIEILLQMEIADFFGTAISQNVSQVSFFFSSGSMSIFRLVYTAKLVFLGHKKNSQSYGKKKKRRRAQRWCHAYALVFPSSRPSCRVVYHTLEEKFKMMQNTYSLNIDIIQLKKSTFSNN